jgi:hypothetical protein
MLSSGMSHYVVCLKSINGLLEPHVFIIRDASTMMIKAAGFYRALIYSYLVAWYEIPGNCISS